MQTPDMITAMRRYATLFIEICQAKLQRSADFLRSVYFCPYCTFSDLRTYLWLLLNSIFGLSDPATIGMTRMHIIYPTLFHMSG